MKRPALMFAMLTICLVGVFVSIRVITSRTFEDTSAKDLRPTSGWTGEGSIVVIIDQEGIDANHPFINGQVIEEVCFGGSCNNMFSEGVPTPGAAAPECSDTGCTIHGTVMAGLIAGKPMQVLPEGEQDVVFASGVAPGAKIIAVKVQIGDAEAFGRALSWIVERAKQTGNPTSIAAVSMSFAAPFSPPLIQDCAFWGDLSPIGDPIGRIRELGIPIFASTGNEGLTNSIGFPACISLPWIFPVGNANDNREVSAFSNAELNKPIIMVQGEGVVSSTPNGDGFIRSSSTSGAAAIAAGYSAILRQVFSSSGGYNVYPVQTTNTNYYSNYLQSHIFPMMGRVVDRRAGAPENASYWLFDIDAAVDIVSRVADISSSADTPGTVVTWNHNPDRTQTSEDVLAAANNEMVIVSAAYTPESSSQDARIQEITYCGQEMSLVGSSPNNSRVGYSGNYVELWQLLTPPSGECVVRAVFNKDPGERYLVATTIKNLDMQNPVAGYFSRADNFASVASLPINFTGNEGEAAYCAVAGTSNHDISLDINNGTLISSMGNVFDTRNFKGVIKGAQLRESGTTNSFIRFIRRSDYDPYATPRPQLNYAARCVVIDKLLPTHALPVKGDANGDYKVDGVDYSIWLINYGTTTSSGHISGDFNGDGKVDGVDYVEWLNNY